MKKALIVVDAQYDFIPATEEEYKNGMGGALAVKEGDKIVPIINEFLPKYELVIFTKDWHQRDNAYFAASHPGKNNFDQMEINGKTETLWPIHCVQNTRGADLHDEINLSLIKGKFFIIKKGVEKNCHPYGGFGDKMEDTGLYEILKEHEITHTVIMGLALDYCVKDTALDSARKGFKTIVIEDGTRAIHDDINETLAAFKNLGVGLIESYEYEEWEKDQIHG